MTKFVAKSGIAAALFATALGNYWFTFGLWPRSWGSFFGFFCISVLLTGLMHAIDAEDK